MDPALCICLTCFCSNCLFVSSEYILPDSQTVSMAADDLILGDSTINEVHEHKSATYLDSEVGDPCQTLCDVPYTRNCSNAHNREINVPKCHDGDVSIVADGPNSGDDIGDGTPQPVKNHPEEVGGAAVSSRKRVESCSALLSTVGKEQSNRVSDSPEASDRAAIQIPRSHGASGIRVSRVSIVADGPFFR